MKNPRRVYWILAAIIAFLFVLAAATSWAYVVRADDKRAEAQARERERTQQLAFLCTRVNAVVDADIAVVSPPGSIQYPQRIERVKALERARCDPNSFHLTK